MQAFRRSGTGHNPDVGQVGAVKHGPTLLAACRAQGLVTRACALRPDGVSPAVCDAAHHAATGRAYDGTMVGRCAHRVDGEPGSPPTYVSHAMRTVGTGTRSRDAACRLPHGLMGGAVMRGLVGGEIMGVISMGFSIDDTSKAAINLSHHAGQITESMSSGGNPKRPQPAFTLMDRVALRPRCSHESHMRARHCSLDGSTRKGR